jgi:UDP-N-acetylglucosamine 1-carboxyvinyltransferase
MQAQFSSLFASLKGTSIITETIFENRFQHICELKRMGANIKIDGRCAVIEGTRLSGATVKATDLRAGAALILCGLIAEGETQIGEIYHIQRGYVDIDKKITALGGNIEIIED